MKPLHATASTLPPMYFWPPSKPENPVLNVLAFFGGETFAFSRTTAGAPWIKTS